MSTSSVIIGFDIGSSGVRCTAYRRDDLSVVSTHRVKRRNVIAEGYIDVEGTLEVVEDLLDKTMTDLGDASVEAMGFSTFCMNLVGVDQDGKIVGNNATLSYAHQSKRVNEEVGCLKSLLDDEKQALIYQRTGAPLHSSYALPQLRVLYESEDDDAQDIVFNVKSWQTLASICLSRWMGRKSLPISYSEASWCGLLNIKSCVYDPLVLDLLPDACKEALPSLVDYTGEGKEGEEPCLLEWKKETILESYFERWPGLKGARLFYGIGDGACANIGSKCSNMERIACTVGTSAAARVCLPLPISDDMQSNSNTTWNLDYFATESTLPTSCVIEWVAQLLNLGSVSSDAFQSCLEAAGKLPLQISSRPTVLPFLSGERSTGFCTGATGVMIGLTRETKPEHFLRGCLEGVTLRLNAIVERILKVMEASEFSSKEQVRIVCSGKALESNELWRQMLADCTKCKIILDKSIREGTSRGVAILLRMALDGEQMFAEERLKDPHTLDPDEKTVPYWKQATDSQEELLGCVTSIFK